MKLFIENICFRFYILICLQKSVKSLSPLWDEVTTNIFQEYDVQEGNDILTIRINMGEYKSTDLVVGEDVRKDSRLIFTCIAHHGPAEWIYSGDGSPIFSTNTTVENLSASGKRLPMEDSNGAKRYVATLTLGQKGITTRDTGRYNCMTSSLDKKSGYKSLSAFYHLFVPAKNKLFVRKSETIYYDLNKSAARIPCGVNQPRASVTLQKFSKGSLEFIPSDAMLYHPISGYYPKKNIKGQYVCTAAFDFENQIVFDFVHFNLFPSSDSGASNKKSSSKVPSYEDLEWLMYPNPNVIKKRPLQTAFTTKKPTRTTASTNPKPSKKGKPTTSQYIPFHLRYSTTTYGPFQTFFNVQTTPTTRTPYDKYKFRTTVKTKPFDPSNYPQDLFDDKKTQGPESDSFIPEELISYRPNLNYLTKKPNYTTHSKWPESSILVHEERPERSTNTPNRLMRTTPRKYRPYTMPTTEIPIHIPESIICSQFNCGINSICYAHMVYNVTLKILTPEPGCKCLPNYKGNPYLECYLPPEYMDPDVLYFNLSSLSRSPVLSEPIYSDSESESGSNSETNDDSTDEEKKRHFKGKKKMTLDRIIDM